METVHVLKHPDGGWAVRRTGAARALRVLPLRADAAVWAQAWAGRRRPPARIVVHRADGTVERILPPLETDRRVT
jgi:hypothetical protein